MELYKCALFMRIEVKITDENKFLNYHAKKC